jgi:iron(III) transport system substrate-binding protein
MTAFGNRWLWIVSIVTVLAWANSSGNLYAQAVNIDAAKKEGKVVVYGAVVPQAMEGLNRGFEKKYGIRVEYWRGDSTKVMDRALTEWRAGRPGFDVFGGKSGRAAHYER